MAVEVIEGTLAPTQPKSRKRGYGRYPQLVVTTLDGGERKLAKVAAGPAMVEQIALGGDGKYYVAKADGALALCGVRRPDGAAHYAHWSNLEPILLVVAVLGLGVGLLRFGFGVDAPLTPIVLAPILLLFWLYLRNQRLSARRAFDAG